MKVLLLLQVLHLAASSSWQVEAHSDEQKTAVTNSSNPVNQTSNLPIDAVGNASRSGGNGTNAHNKTTTDMEFANEQADRENVDAIESSQVNTELSNTSNYSEVLMDSSRGIDHIEDLLISASPTNTAAAMAALPVTDDVGITLRRVLRDVKLADEAANSDNGDQDGNKNVPDSSETFSYDVSNLASFTTSAAAWHSSMSNFESVTKSESSAIEVSTINASTGVTESPLIETKTIGYLDEAMTSSLKSDDESRWTRNVTGETTNAENDSSPSVAREAAMTLTATVTFTDVTSQSTDNAVNGDRIIADHPPLAIIVAACAGGAFSLTALITAVWLLCRYRRRHLERKKLQISQQEPRLSVLWPQPLQTESSLVPRYDHIRIPREQPIEMGENDQFSAITRSPLFCSFNDEAG